MSNKHHKVTWEIDVEGVDSPLEAAEKAWALMRKPDSTANFFSITDPNGVIHQVDLWEEQEVNSEAEVISTPDDATPCHAAKE